MRKGLAGAGAAAVLALAGAATVEAAIRTDRLSGGELRAWRSIVGVVRAMDLDGNPLHPTLHRLFHELETSVHLIQIEMLRLRGSSGTAGQFRIETLGKGGRHEGSIRLNLRTIDHVLTGPQEQTVPFVSPGRHERRAQVLGHELAHAVWAFAEPDRARLALEVHERAQLLARRAQTVGIREPGFGAQVEESERLIRLLEEPAIAAEAAIAAELAAGRLRR
jgi:hypothetical protein